MRNLIAMYIALQTWTKSMFKDEKGATMVEYALMVALIAIIAMVGAGALGISVNGAFNDISDAIGGGGAAPPAA